MMKLFKDFERSRKVQSEHREPRYKFLNESSWDWVEYYRSVINEWYQIFPYDNSFYQSFTSDNDVHHASAFFELYMFMLFHKMGYEVRYHQPIQRRKIDLTLIKDEVKMRSDCVLSGEPNLDRSIELIEKEIQDIIERIKTPQYWIGVRFLRTSQQTPKLSRIRAILENEVKSLDLEIGEIRTRRFSEGKWTIDFLFSKKSPPVERSLASVISSQRGGFIDGTSMAILRKTLDTKRGKNYLVQCPYFICVNTSNFALYDELIKGALYGKQEIEGFRNDLFLEDAFFYRDEPRNTSVSGVLIVHRLYESNMGSVKMSFWENPWAKYSLSNTIQDLTRFHPILNSERKIEKIEIIHGKKAYELLEIEEHYHTYDH